MHSPHNNGRTSSENIGKSTDRNDQQDRRGAEGGKLPVVPAFRTLLKYMKPFRVTLFIVSVSTLIAILSDLLQPYLMKIAIDDNLLSDKQDFKQLIYICAIYFGLSLSSFIFTYIQNNLLQYIGQNIVAKIRKELFEHISKLSMRYFDRVSSGSLITNVSSDTEALNQFFNQVLLSLFRDGLMLVFILVMMFQLDTELALYCLVLLPIIFVIAILFRTKIRKAYQTTRARLSQTVAFVAENLNGMQLIQVFHQEKEQQKQFVEKNQSYYNANLREIKLNVLFRSSFEILANLSIALVTWLGGKAVLGTTLEFGVLYAFITYIRQFFQPINTITQQWNTFQSASVALSRIWSVFAIKPDVTDELALDRQRQGKKLLTKEQVEGKVAFRNVTFAYNEGEAVIKQLSLAITPGEMIGVVGATGAGKSSLISLLCRFYDVQIGSVTIDDVDVRHIRQADLHRIVGLVQQEPYLYSGTIIDNVRMFDETISREAVIEACRFVGAEAIVERLEDGYETQLSERGSGLSAGERQLISFARIIVFQPKILILDEASANLDSETEQLITQALATVSQNRTTIVIAHRLSTIVHADRIIVMEDGQIVEAGSHQQLLKEKGYYNDLYTYATARKEHVVM
ncbi:ABC transporter ATP-binding protein [Paenibacillus yanchengensis]|uniref:ABC transporter ATP-binding protein n=1 Tax=Paenibacillus yanchengensis TaxID=2035833 RepID=A0ABW4YLY6_9BACL